MSELTLGGGKATWDSRWSKPSPKYINGVYRSNGMVFIGKTPASEKDYDTLKAIMRGKPYRIDILTVGGLWDAAWTTYADLLARTPPEHMMGGFGSAIYMMQKMFEGVRITENPIWLHGTDEDGVHTMDKIVPPNYGAYHMVHVGDGYMDAYEGAEPDSQADKYIGDKDIFFDDENGWYAVEKMDK